MSRLFFGSVFINVINCLSLTIDEMCCCVVCSLGLLANVPSEYTRGVEC